jgi:hypothetical protein
MNTLSTNTLAVTVKDFELRSIVPLSEGVRCLSGRSKTLCATVVTLGLLVCGRGAYSQAAEVASHPQFEQASVEVPAGNDCVLHPKDNSDPSQSISLRSDADGVARFLAVRPTLPTSVDTLALDCTDSHGYANTFLVDLRSEEMFAERPFDPARANLAFRPGLAGDPLSFTLEQLVEAGYGVRPDPVDDPDGYQTWLAAVREPAYKLKAAPRPSSAPQSSHPIDFGQVREAAQIRADHFGSVEPESVFLSPRTYWTGAILNGSYQLGATSAKTYGYVKNQVNFVVPEIYPNLIGTKNTAATIWNGLDDVFQAIVDVGATPLVGGYLIHRQNFYHDEPKGSIDEQGTDFTPKKGDEIFAEEWYCDSKGDVKMAGGYGCSIMIDKTQNIEWECDQSNSKECQSYPIESKYLTNGALGQTAEFIIEDDTGETDGNCPKATKTTNCYDEWIGLGPVTMTGSALVVQGTGTSPKGKTVNTSSDPFVQLWTDTAVSVPFVFGDQHFIITLPSGGVKWSPVKSNVYYWNGSNFDSLVTPQESPNTQPGVIFTCASWLAVGPSSRGLTNGTPWSTGCTAAKDGNYNVYEMQTGGKWVLMQSDIATQVATSPEGDVWAVNAKGDILYWNGSDFVANPTGGCATFIAVGPNSRGLTRGTPWTTGCHAASDGNYDVYQMQTDGKWVKMQSDIATHLAVSPEGNAWALNKNGQILYWNGSKFVENAKGGCAINIGVGPNSRGLTNGTPWTVGCTPGPTIPPINSVYQMQTGGNWVKMQSYAGVGVAVSPEGNAWTITFPQPF